MGIRICSEEEKQKLIDKLEYEKIIQEAKWASYLSRLHSGDPDTIYRSTQKDWNYKDKIN